MATDAPKEAASGGMPQLDFATFPNQIFWLIVALVVIYFILSRVALPRIGGALAERARKISGDLALAEDLKQRAVASESAYEHALAAARAEAQKIATDMRAEIQAQLDVELQKADAEIAAKSAEAAARLADIKASAVASVKAVATDTAQELVTALGASTDGKSAEATVAAAMKG